MSSSHTFYPGLQGLRGVAAGLVFFSHYLPLVYPTQFWRWGSVGVDIFFVLSGFLITGILRASRNRPDYFRRFYRNRAYRIFPVFYGLWLLLFVLTPWLRPAWTWRMLTVPVYLGNFFEFGRVGTDGLLTLGVRHGRTVLMLAQLWTLTVEEHFYLVWPLVVWLVGSVKRLRAIAIAGVVATLVLRCYLVFHLPQTLLYHGRVYYSSYTRMDSILIGSLLSLWFENGGSEPATRRRAALWLTWIPAALLVAGQVLLPAWQSARDYNWQFESYGITLVAVFSCGLLLRAIDQQSRLYRVLTLKPLMSLGLISYSFYVLHYLPFVIWKGYANRFSLNSPMMILWLLLIFAVSYAMAALSYRFVELPFLRIKERRNSRSQAEKKAFRMVAEPQTF